MLNPDQIKQMIQWSSQNPDNPNALEFQRRIQSGQYNDSLSQLGVDTNKFATSAPQVQQEPPKEQGALPGLVSDIGSAIQKRGQNFAQQSADIAQQTKDQPTTPGQPPAWLEAAPQQALSFLGQGAGALMDIVGSAAKRVGGIGGQLLDKIAPGFTKDIGNNLQDMVSKISTVPVVMKDAMGNNKEITIGDIFSGGADSWNKFKQSNPAQAADIENTLNIIGTFYAPAKAKEGAQAVEGTASALLPDIASPIEKTAKDVIGSATEKMATRAAGKAEESVIKAATPDVSKLAPTEYEKLVAQGKISPKTATKPAEYIMSDAEKQAALKHKELFTSPDPVVNTGNVMNKIADYDKQVGTYLKQNNSIFNKGELKNYLMNKIQGIDDITIPEDRLNKAKEQLVNSFIEGLPKNDMEGLWNGRKTLDRAKAGMFSGTPTTQKELLKSIRNGAQDFISEHTGDGVYKGYMKDMSGLFDIADTLESKAAAEKGKSGFEVWKKNNPKLWNIIKGSVIVGGAAKGFHVLGL